MLAWKGRGMEHAKWSPVATVAMAPVPKINFDWEKMWDISETLWEQIVASCPAKVFWNDPENLEGIDIENLTSCMLCDECVKCAKQGGHEGLIKVGVEEDWWIFTVESTGALPPQVIVQQAFDIMIGKIKNTSSEVDKLDH